MMQNDPRFKSRGNHQQQVSLGNLQILSDNLFVDLSAKNRTQNLRPPQTAKNQNIENIMRL